MQPFEKEEKALLKIIKFTIHQFVLTKNKSEKTTDIINYSRLNAQITTGTQVFVSFFGIVIVMLT